MMMSVLFSWKIQYINRNMLERYVTDEFKAVDKDFSNSMYTLRFKSSEKRENFSYSATGWRKTCYISNKC